MVQKISTIEKSIKETITSKKEQLNNQKKQIAICEKFSSDALIANSAKTLLTYGEWIVTNMDELREQVEHISSENLKMPAPIVQVKFIDSIPSVCGVEPDIPLCGPIVTADKVKLNVSLSGFCQPQQPSKEQYSEKQLSDVNVYCNKTEGFLTDLDNRYLKIEYLHDDSSLTIARSCVVIG